MELILAANKVHCLQQHKKCLLKSQLLSSINTLCDVDNLNTLCHKFNHFIKLIHEWCNIYQTNTSSNQNSIHHQNKHLFSIQIVDILGLLPDSSGNYLTQNDLQNNLIETVILIITTCVQHQSNKEPSNQVKLLKNVDFLLTVMLTDVNELNNGSHEKNRHSDKLSNSLIVALQQHFVLFGNNGYNTKLSIYYEYEQYSSYLSLILKLIIVFLDKKLNRSYINNKENKDNNDNDDEIVSIDLELCQICINILEIVIGKLFELVLKLLKKISSQGNDKYDVNTSNSSKIKNKWGNSSADKLTFLVKSFVNKLLVPLATVKQLIITMCVDGEWSKV